MKKGLNTWTITGFDYLGVPSVPQIIEKTSELGYDGLEFCFDNRTLDPDNISKEERRRYLELAESHQLSFPSVATGVFWSYNLASPDESLRRKGLEYLKKGIELAHDLAAKVLLVVPAVASAQVPYEETYRRSQDSLRNVAGYAEEHDVIMGVENVWNKFLYSPLEFKRFLDELNHEYIKAYLDVGNTLNLGFPQHWILLLKDMIATVHVKDFDLAVGNITGFRHLLKGSMDWKTIIEALKSVGYDYFLTVECPPEFYPDLKEPKYPEDGVRAARDNVEALKKIL